MLSAVHRKRVMLKPATFSLALALSLHSAALALEPEPALLAQASPSAGQNQGAGSSRGVLPPVLRAEADLPEPVRSMRQRLMEAARTGDMERLRALMAEQPEPPAVSLGNAGTRSNI
jgi:hypothetical protein